MAKPGWLADAPWIPRQTTADRPENDRRVPTESGTEGARYVSTLTCVNHTFLDIWKKTQGGSGKTQAIFPENSNLLRNSRICPTKAIFFLTFSGLCENFSKISPQNYFFTKRQQIFKELNEFLTFSLFFKLQPRWRRQDWNGC